MPAPGFYAVFDFNLVESAGIDLQPREMRLPGTLAGVNMFKTCKMSFANYSKSLPYRLNENNLVEYLACGQLPH